MRPNTAVRLLAVALAVGASLSWIVLASDPGPRVNGAIPMQSRDEDTGSFAPAPLTERDSVGAVAPHGDPAARPLEIEPIGTPYVLEARVANWTDPVRLIVGPHGRLLAEDSADIEEESAAGSFQLDVTKLGEHLRAGGLVSVRAEAGDRSWGPRLLGLGDFERDEVSGYMKARVAIEFELHAAPGIRGRVVDERFQPIEGAKVATLTRGAASADDWVADSEARTAADGTFALPVHTPGEGLLIVSAESRPMHQEVTFLPPHGVVDLGDVVLDPGVSLSGIVIWSRPPPYRVLVGPRVAGSMHVSGGWEAMGWVEGRLRRMWAQGDTDAEGRFRISGLEPGPHVLDFHSPLLGFPVAALPGLDRSLEVVVPDQGIQFIVDTPAVFLRASSAGSPVARAGIELQSGESSWSVGGTGLEGILVVLVPPETDFTAVVTAEGYWAAEAAFTTPRRGEVIDVEVPLRTRDVGKVAVTVADEASKPIRRAALSFFREGELVRKWSGSSSNGEFLVEDLPVGPYMLEIADEHRSLSSSLLVPAQIDVEVRAHETTRYLASLLLGGRITIRIVDSSGRPVSSASCQLRDSRGHRIDAVFLVTDPTSGTFQNSREQVPSVAELPTNVWPPLPEGEYTIALEAEGYEPREQRVTVVRGKVTDARVVLAPEQP